MDKVPLEICRKSITISRTEETHCEWCFSHLAVRTDKGLHFFELSHNLECLDKRLNCIESFLETPTSSPSTDIYNCDLVRQELKNRDICEMMTDTAMWSHSDHLIHEMSNILAFEFSPRDLVREKVCALAVLNNIGNVVLFTTGRCSWNPILDMSSYVRDYFSEMLTKTPTDFNDLKKTAHNLSTCSMCWAPYAKDGQAYLVTSQKSGVLMFWSIQSTGDTLTSKLSGNFELAFDEIVHVKWIPRSNDNFVLFCSNILGQVLALECHINEGKVILINSHMLWEHQDRMAAKFSEYYVDGSQVIVFYNKHRHLVTQLIDERCRVISQSVKNVNDYRLTSLTKSSSKYYVTTVNFKFYRINYSIDNNNLHVTFANIDIKDISPTIELFDIKFSNNNVMCALCVLDRRVMHKKEPLLLDVIFIQAVPDSTVVETLLNNPTKRLSNYWDCVELLRCKIMKSKTLPAIDFKALLAEGNTDMYKLKIYLIILRMYRTLVENIKLQTGSLPENSVEVIKDRISLLQAKANIEQLYNKHRSGEALNNFEMESFVGSKRYLTFYSEKYKTNLADIITFDMSSIDVKEYCYTCQCCDEYIKTFTCKTGHLNMFCSLSFTPIENLDYLTCKYCNTLARFELYSQKPLCIFCDSYLEIDHICK